MRRDSLLSRAAAAAGKKESMIENPNSP